MTTAETSHIGIVDRFVASSDPAANLRFLGVGMVVGGALMTALPATNVILCPLRAITGVPCPFCGMTTGTLALARGDMVGSIAANPAAIVLVVAVLLAFVPVSARRALAAIGATVPRPPPWLVWVMLAPLWLWQLARFGLI